MSDTARLFRAWTLSCAAGEFLGIGAAAGIVGCVVLLFGEPTRPLEKLGALGAMVVAGVLEGTVLGLLQWRVLRRRFPGMDAASWVGATIAVAAFGWLIGGLPSTLANAPAPATTLEGSVPGFSPGVIVLLAALFGLGVGSVFGAAQWLVLRRYAARAGRWIAANALGWAVALPWIYLAASVLPANTGLALMLVAGAAGGIAAGLSVGAVTGAFLVRLEPRPA